MAVTKQIEIMLDDILDEKHINTLCSSCGKSSAFDKKDFEIFALYRQGIGNVSTENIETVLTMTCYNCGFMRIYSAKKLGIMGSKKLL